MVEAVLTPPEDKLADALEEEPAELLDEDAAEGEQNCFLKLFDNSRQQVCVKIVAVRDHRERLQLIQLIQSDFQFLCHRQEVPLEQADHARHNRGVQFVARLGVRRVDGPGWAPARAGGCETTSYRYFAEEVKRRACFFFGGAGASRLEEVRFLPSSPSACCCC